MVSQYNIQVFKVVRNAWCVMKWNKLISLMFWKLHVMSLNGQHLDTKTQLAENLNIIAANQV